MTDDEHGERDVEDTDEQSAVSGAGRTPGGASGETFEVAVPKPGEKVGRYMVLERVGAGGMGVVLAAYDPELERKVALKLLRAGGGGSSVARQRLVREAQSLARLSHRNVVAVHDVGVHEGDVFIAMEFVKGQTLGEWMASEDGPRPWREVVRTFVEAGRGLAAAHRAGLVHRDFKPDNVMLDERGRVVVMDFGLARADEASEAERENLEESIPESSLAGRLTRHDSLVGTPIYMSPEQLVARPADARSDQFGFCASLYEGLYGERPFAGKSVPELWRATTESLIRPVPRRSSVPGWVRAAVVRGLAPRPEERWPSMEALLEALEADPRARRHRWLAAGGLCTALVGATWGAVSLADREPDLTCVGLERHLDGVWDDERRAQVRAAIEATELSYADATWERVEPLLDEYGQKWVEARTEACEATQRGEQSATLLDRRMACLDHRLIAVDSTVRVLIDADATVVHNAISMVAGLPPLEPCADHDALMAEVPPPKDPEAARRVETLRRELSDIAKLEDAGKYKDGLEAITELVIEAEDLDFEPAKVWTRLQYGTLQAKLGRHAEAETQLERTYVLALEHGMTQEAAAASIDLVAVVGYYLARADDGHRWAKLAAAPLARATKSAIAEARLFKHLGGLASLNGNYEQASEHDLRSLEILEQALGPDHPTVGDTLHNLGVDAYELHEYDEARRYVERAYEVQVRVRGEGHPLVANSLKMLGSIAAEQGKYDEAAKQLERARVIYQAALGPSHPNVAFALEGLGTVAQSKGDYNRAREYFERALKIREDSLDEDAHYLVAYAHGNLGSLAADQGRHHEAKKHYLAALSIQEESLKPDHPDLAWTYNNLGSVSSDLGELSAARDYLSRALEIREQVFGADSTAAARILENLACVETKAGNLVAAREAAERALSIMDEALDSPKDAIADVLVNLAEIDRLESKYEMATDRFRRAMSIHDELKLRPDAPDRAYPIFGLGRVALDRGRYAKAIRYLEQAVGLWEPTQLGDLAETKFALARALWMAPGNEGRDRERALELAQLALADAEQAGEVAAENRAEIEEWLASVAKSE